MKHVLISLGYAWLTLFVSFCMIAMPRFDSQDVAWDRWDSFCFGVCVFNALIVFLATL